VKSEYISSFNTPHIRSKVISLFIVLHTCALCNVSNSETDMSIVGAWCLSFKDLKLLLWLVPPLGMSSTTSYAYA